MYAGSLPSSPLRIDRIAATSKVTSIVHQRPDFDALTRWSIGTSERVWKRRMWNTNTSPRLSVRLAEDPRFVGLLVADVVPFLSRLAIDLAILDHVIVIDEVGGLEIFGVDGTRVAESEWPIADRTL
jgi:hypothetical protein